LGVDVVRLLRLLLSRSIYSVFVIVIIPEFRSRSSSISSDFRISILNPRSHFVPPPPPAVTHTHPQRGVEDTSDDDAPMTQAIKNPFVIRSSSITVDHRLMLSALPAASRVPYAVQQAAAVTGGNHLRFLGITAPVFDVALLPCSSERKHT
jgi:hypothetical protein